MFFFGTCIAYICYVGDVQTTAQIGDSFGAFNALFSAFAVTALVVSIAIQRNELRVQKQELELTRQEMRQQTEQFVKQTKLDEVKVLDSSMFEYLNGAKLMKEQFQKNKIELIYHEIHNFLEIDPYQIDYSKDKVLEPYLNIINQFRMGFENIAPWSSTVDLWFQRVDDVKNEKIKIDYKTRYLSFYTHIERFVMYFSHIYLSNECGKSELRTKFNLVYEMDSYHKKLLTETPIERINFIEAILSAYGVVNPVYLEMNELREIIKNVKGAN